MPVGSLRGLFRGIVWVGRWLRAGAAAAVAAVHKGPRSPKKHDWRSIDSGRGPGVWAAAGLRRSSVRQDAAVVVVAVAAAVAVDEVSAVAVVVVAAEVRWPKALVVLLGEQRKLHRNGEFQGCSGCDFGGWGCRRREGLQFGPTTPATCLMT